MKKRFTTTALALALSAAMAPIGASSVAAADSHSELTASVRIGLTYEETTGDNGEIFLRNFGTRLKWKGKKAINDDLTAIGYVELGLNPDTNQRNVANATSGADRTRQLWAGVKGNFGTVRVGAQYASFYDTISSNTDIAWWGSCWTQFECARETNVIKYNATRGDLSYSASIVAPEDDDDNFADQFELGINYIWDDYTFGIATSIQADSGDNDGGSLLGLMAKGDLGPLGLALTLQRADADFAGADDSADNLTVAATYDNYYLIVNDGDNAGGTTDFATLGYTYKISDSALMYFEYQNVSNDVSDDDTFARATFKLDF
jgi:predicted porin